jgi:type II secretory pathway pseudopilin PulG
MIPPDDGKGTAERPLAPGRCLTVLLGASEWIAEAGYPPAPEFAASASGLRDYLRAPAGLGVPEHLLIDLFDSRENAAAQLSRLRVLLRDRLSRGKAAMCDITDLLVFGISHGEGTRHNPRDLHLIVHDTERGFVDGTGLSVRQLAAVLQTSAPRLRRYVVLDCCFSGAALAHFQSSGEGVATLVAADIRREANAAADPAGTLTAVAPGAGAATYGSEPPLSIVARDRPARSRRLPALGTVLLCSSHADDLSLAKSRDGRTLLTGTLLRVLSSRGMPHHNHDETAISFARLRDEAWAIILEEVGSSAPYPQLYTPQQSQGDLSTVPLLPRLRVTHGGESTDRSSTEECPRSATEVGTREHAAAHERLGTPPADDQQTRTAVSRSQSRRGPMLGLALLLVLTGVAATSTWLWTQEQNQRTEADRRTGAEAARQEQIRREGMRQEAPRVTKTPLNAEQTGAPQLGRFRETGDILGHPGMCDASAAVAFPEGSVGELLIVANDEDNTLRAYAAGTGSPTSLVGGNLGRDLGLQTALLQKSCG